MKKILNRSIKILGISTIVGLATCSYLHPL